MNRALSVFRKPWKIFQRNMHSQALGLWAFTISLRVLHGDGNPINDNVKAQCNM